VCRSFSISAAEATAASGRNRELRLGAATRVPLYYSHKSLSLSSEIC